MESELNDILKEPDPARAFLRLEEFYRLADAVQQAEIRTRWEFKREWRIPGMDYSDFDRILFTPLAGEDRYGLDAQARIETRLTYHSIENARSDFRDTTLDVYLCYHAALEAGLDVRQLFEEAAAISEPWMAGLFRGFLSEAPEEHCLWNMGLRRVFISNGIAFEWIGSEENFSDLKPRHLDEWGREIAA